MSAALSLPVRRFDPSSFDTVREDVERRHALALPDAIVRLSALRMTDEGMIDVPGRGPLALNRHSQRQVATLLGVKWSRWFDAERISPKEAALEVNLRFERTPGELKVRARRHAEGEEPVGAGLLRAFVTPSYAAIDDAQLFARMAQVFGAGRAEYRFASVAVTEAFSFYAVVRPGETDLGRRSADPHVGGFMLRNSEVGAGAVVILGRLLRLACLNGLLLSDGIGALFRRAHRPGPGDAIDNALQAAISALPGELADGAMLLRAARGHDLPEARKALESRVKGERELRPFLIPILRAYDREPEPNRFGLIQAVTLAAQSLEPEERHLLERFAGRLLLERGDA